MSIVYIPCHTCFHKKIHENQPKFMFFTVLKIYKSETFIGKILKFHICAQFETYCMSTICCNWKHVHIGRNISGFYGPTNVMLFVQYKLLVMIVSDQYLDSDNNMTITMTDFYARMKYQVSRRTGYSHDKEIVCSKIYDSV